ncbi:MAG: hypothetical protein M3040_00520 [Bacteroidota bacterium]|nr:hypothetical protein [Bacteroidota bacterium]
MENGKYENVIKAEESTDWYSEEFISNALVVFLKKNGYKIHEEKPKTQTGKAEKIITVSKFFTKEIIGIKGLQPANDRSSLLKVLDKNDPTLQAKSWFYESLFNSFINFGKYYSDENAVGAMALPNVERYKAIIETVEKYFISNNLHFKLYLVDESGDVEVFNLNESDHK